MAVVPDKVLSWLYGVLTSEYHDVNRTYSDVAQTLSQYPTLHPRTEVYTYENGVPALLLQLGGTIPVQFRGTTYRFPLILWIPHAYPRESPMVYVTPTQGMLIRPGQHVSGEGRVYHPYLAQWAQYWDKSTLIDFLGVLRDVFAKEPPVRSVQDQQPPVRQVSQPPPPVPPPPDELRKSVQSHTPTTNQSQEPPPKPPKPHDGSTIKQPTSAGSANLPAAPAAATPPLLPHKPTSYARTVPERPRNGAMPTVGSGLRQSTAIEPRSFANMPSSVAQHSFPRHGYEQYQRYPGSPVSPVSPELPPQYPQSLPQRTTSMQQPPFGQTAVQAPSYGAGVSQQFPNTLQGPPHTASYVPPIYQQAQQQAPVQKQANQPPPPDLLSSPLDVTIPSQNNESLAIPAPPIPPNPQKDALLSALSTALRSHLAHTVNSNISALTPLRAQNRALHEAQAALHTELDQLQQLDAALASNEQILRDAMREADRVMDDARRRKVPEVDEVLVAPTVVGGQLYELCAEEVALREALFVIAKGLDKGRVSAETFVKQTRSLAREQFLKKALVKKIANGLGLDDFDRQQGWKRT